MVLVPSETPNPYYAFVHASIDDKELIGEKTAPDRLVEFQYIRNNNISGNRVRLSVIDKNWPEVESILVANKFKKMKFKYGYSGGAESPEYEAEIINYIPDLKEGVVEIQIEALSLGFSASSDKDFVRSAVYKGKDIHEIVEFIADQRGWGKDIDPCWPVYDNDDLKKTERVKATFTQQRMRDLEFIAKILIPRATKFPTGVGDYKLWIEDSIPPVLHFHPPRYEKKETKLYTYLFGEKQSEIISFRPDIQGIFNLRLGGGIAGVPFIDVTTGEFKDVYVDNNTITEKPVLGGKLTFAQEKGDRNYFSAIDTIPARDENQAAQLAAVRFCQMHNQVMKAEMTIIGDPKLRTHDVVRINVVMPNGKLHYASGLWYIMNATDSIAGSYTTTLELMRNAFLSVEGVAGDPVVGKVNQ